MTDIDIYFGIYFCIGLVLAFVFWKTDYEVVYLESKRTGEVEEGMVGILIIALILLWPVKLTRRLYRNYYK